MNLYREFVVYFVATHTFILKIMLIKTNYILFSYLYVRSAKRYHFILNLELFRVLVIYVALDLYHYLKFNCSGIHFGVQMCSKFIYIFFFNVERLIMAPDSN